MTLTDHDVIDAYNAIGSDLAQAMADAGESKAHVDDLADAIFNYLSCDRNHGKPDVKADFVFIKKVIREKLTSGDYVEF